MTLIARALIASGFAVAGFAFAPASSSQAPSAQLNVRTDVACAATTAGPLQATSDPEEGGQVVARTAKPAPKAKPQISDINVTKTSDKGSATLSAAAPPATPAPACQH
jgi:hypothetical protein